MKTFKRINIKIFQKIFKYLHYCFHVFAYELFFQNLQLTMARFSVIYRKQLKNLYTIFIWFERGGKGDNGEGVWGEEACCCFNLMQRI